MDGYVAAKKRIFDHPREAASAVIGMDDRYCREMCFELMLRGEHKIIPISGTNRAPGGVYAEDGVLIDDLDNGQARVLDLKSVGTLPGAHNWQNAAAAYAAARAGGLEPDAIVSGIASYPGLAHRQELIATVGGVPYVNDSKATNVEAALRALACYRNVHWIAGGQAKEGGFAALLEAAPRIRHAYLIGEAAEEIARDLGTQVPHSQCGDLETAFAAAHEAAKDGETILLSPACASFDQFDNFEARGEAFRKLVEALA
jgi:UDP-N-acetylmuramoylalanine--D-glutamate ligase